MNRFLLRNLVLVVLMTMVSLGCAFSTASVVVVQHKRVAVVQLQHQTSFTTSSTAIFSEKPGSARFTGLQKQDATSGLDLVLRVIVSDAGSIVMGLVGLLIAVGYRLAHQDELSADTMGQETRTDLLAVFACGAVLLNGISKLDVTSVLAEAVVLDGVDVDHPVVYSDEKVPKDLLWGIESLLSATPAMTVVFLEWNGNAWESVAAGGTLVSDETLRVAPRQSVNPILDRFLKDGDARETYLPTLQAIPGRVEFTYLPSNTQGALLLPVSSNQVLVLGSNTAKSFTPRDVAWCQVVASRIGETG